MYAAMTFASTFASTILTTSARPAEYCTVAGLCSGASDATAAPTNGVAAHSSPAAASPPRNRVIRFRSRLEAFITKRRPPLPVGCTMALFGVLSSGARGACVFPHEIAQASALRWSLRAGGLSRENRRVGDASSGVLREWAARLSAILAAVRSHRLSSNPKISLSEDSPANSPIPTVTLFAGCLSLRS